MTIALLPTSDAISTSQFNPACDLTIEEVRENLDTYRRHPNEGFEAMRDCTDVCADPQIAAVFVECCIAAGRLDIAEIALELASDPQGCLAASLHMVNGNPAQALASLNGRPEDAVYRARSFGLRIRANIATDNYEGAAAAADEWSTQTPNSPSPMRIMAKTLAEAGDARAESWFVKAIETSGGRPALVLDLVEFLLRHGKAEAAKDHLSAITEATDHEKRRKDRLLQAI